MRVEGINRHVIAIGVKEPIVRFCNNTISVAALAVETKGCKVIINEMLVRNSIKMAGMAIR